MRYLDSLSSSHLTAVKESLTHSTQWNLGSLKLILGLSSNHEHQAAFGGTGCTTCHWCVTKHQIRLPGYFPKLCGCLRVDRRGVEDHNLLWNTRKDATFRQQCLLNVFCFGQSSNDKVVRAQILTCFLDRIVWLNANCLGLLKLLLAQIEAMDFKAIVDEVGGHGKTHVSHTDESDSLFTVNM